MVKRYDPNRIPDLNPPENREILIRYVRHNELNRVSPNTITNKIARLAPFLKWAGIVADKIPASTIEDYFLDRMGRLSQATINGDVIEWRVFYNWLIGADAAKELLKNIQKSRKVRELPVEQILTRSDIQELINHAEKMRDKALVGLLWDSGARITEILDINIGNVTFDRFGATVIVRGKTGRRQLRLVSSVPDLMELIEQHPYKTNHQNPLFVTSRAYSGGGARRLAGRTVNALLDRLGKQAGIQKPCNPHAIRHARLTDLAREGLSEMELRIVAGWAKSSNMPEVYLHLSGADVERKILKSAGIVTEEEERREVAMNPVKCPRCREMNSPGSMFCRKCSMALTASSMTEIDDAQRRIQEELVRTPDLAEQLIALLKKNK
ncbi:MAG: integrase [Methanocalculus sp. MSAO_Arc2]|uniref:tyrosine-type recombinase/integrase n=1 Tax=Methanocalculus sp. MSAO_Arc2 TaxID=2293855 RepID=UPI000FF13745|nr:MAG: integrase [Methanocalculus sp. MSAO_Arc2]